ncbi:MAG: T9SS type A sorting domain-containing protein [Candidatus Kapabacteria bacterium]|nr:T9SS type A sorting domain-containing protein [Candidatus Kapabacteria bacterium]
MKKIFLLILILAGENCYSFNWKYHSKPNGMMITSILTYDEYLIFAGTDLSFKTSNEKSGIIKSTDGGLSWSQINDPVLKNTICTYLLKDRKNNIWAIIDKSKIFKSSDSGETWVQKGSGFKSIKKIIEADNGNFVISGDTDFLISRDNGESWELIVKEFMDIWDITKTKNGEIFILPNKKGIWKSTNNGESFFDFTKETLYDKDARVIFTDNSNNLWVSTWNKIYFSSDTGNTWQSKMNGLQLNLYYPKGKCYAQDPINGDILLGTFGSLLQKYDNEKEMWVNYNKDFQCETINTLSFNNKGNLFVGDYVSGIFLTQNGGKEWLFTNTNVGRKVVTQLFSHNDRLYIGNYDGSVYLLDDNVVSTKPVMFATPILGNVMSVFVTKNGSILICRYSDDFYQSNDFGKTWVKLYNEYKFRPYTFIERYDTLFAGAGMSSPVKGIFFSTNDGKTWNVENSNFANQDIRMLKKNNEEQIIAGTSTGVYIKNFVTKNWDETSFPKTAPFEIVINSLGDIFAGYHNNNYTSIYKSSNNGLTVEEIIFPIKIKKMILIDNESSSMMDDIILAADSTWYIIRNSKINKTFEQFYPVPQNGNGIWSLTYNKSINSIFAGYFYGLYELNLNSTSINHRNHILNNYNISPNPASDFIDINLNNEASINAFGKVQIFDILGLEVGQSSLIDGNNRIDISHLPAGVYFIRIGDKVEKFVKM